MDKKRLDGWKEIADHLGRDVRTCQRWERELELPVYRVNQESNRSKVFSYTTELDEWFSLTLKNNNGERRGIRTKKWIVPILLLIVLVAVFFGLFSFVFNENNQPIHFSKKGLNPVRWDIKGSQIVVYDVQDQILWTKEINNPTPQEKFYVFGHNSPETDFWMDNKNNRNKIILEDIDNDNKNEAFFYFNHEDQELRCITLFDNNGQKMWTKNLEFDQEYKEGLINNDFKIIKLAFEDVDGDAQKEILALWNHDHNFSSIFLIYNLNGKELFRYIHTGLLQFFVLNSVKEKERFIFLGGTNNLLGGDAVLSVLACKDLRSGLGPPFNIPEDLIELESLQKYIPVNPEKAHIMHYIRFKQNEISRMKGIKWLSVLEARVGENEITVHVNCGLDSICPLYFIFDSDFNLKNVIQGADFGRLYSSLYEEGKVELKLEDFLEKCEADVSFWNGLEWISPSKE